MTELETEQNSGGGDIFHGFENVLLVYCNVVHIKLRKDLGFV